MGVIEQQLAETRTLAAGAHEDVGTVQAVLNNHSRVINGWGEQLNARLDVVETRVGGVETRLGGVETRLGEHTGLLNEILRRLPGPGEGAP